MLCPNCKTENLVTTERQTIQIDHCPRCRGVWLDRGELEKMLQMSSPDEGRQSDQYNGREFGEDEKAPRKRGYSETEQEDDDDDERGESARGREQDDDDNNSGSDYPNRERDDGDTSSQRGPTYRNRPRGDDISRERGGSYQNPDQGSRDGEPGGKSIWREIFENLGDRIPRP